MIRTFPQRGRCLVAFLLLILARGVPLSAQDSGNPPVPEYYGTYAFASGKVFDISTGLPNGANVVQAQFGRIAGENSTFGTGAGLCQGESVAQVSTNSVPEMPSDVQFLVYAQPSGPVSPMMFGQGLKLSAITYIRNVQVSGCSFSGGAAKEGTENAWDLGFVNGSIELRLKPVPNRQDMVLAVPTAALKPGVYLLQGEFKEALSRPFVFFVSPLSDGEASNCMDLSIFTLATLGGIGRQEFKPCGTPLSNSSERETIAPTAPACGDYQTCMRSGLAAFQSFQLDQALSQFQQASVFDSTKGEAWGDIGGTYFELGRYDDATQMWDKALRLGATLAMPVCRQSVWSGCDPGRIQISANEVSLFDSKGQKVFAAPKAQVVSQGAVLFFNNVSAYLPLRVFGKSYKLFLLPIGVTCMIGQDVECPEPGFTQQKVFANYAHKAMTDSSTGEPTPAPGPSASTPATCGQAVDLGYAILLEGHLYKVTGIGAASPSQVHIFFDEKNAQVTDSNLLPQLASAAWTRENVVVSPDAKNGSGHVAGILGTSNALQDYSTIQDVLARAMVEALEAAVTDGASLSKAIQNLTKGVVVNQLKSAPETVFVLTAQRGLEESLAAYKKMEAVPLPPANATVLNGPDLVRIKEFYIQARTLELPYEALAAKLMPTSASQLASQAFGSIVSEAIPSLGLGSTDQVTLKALLDFQKSVGNASASLPALQAYSQNLNLALKLAAANSSTISTWTAAAGHACNQ